MSSSNIVDLNARRPAVEAADAAQKLVGQLRDLSCALLKAAITTVFTEVDDTLFEMSEKTGDGLLKQQYFDDLRTLRRTRDGATERFDAAMRGAFMLYAHGRPLHGAHAATEQRGDELSLVDEGELELSLALNRIAARCDENVTRPRLELTKRLQFMLHRKDGDIVLPLSGSIVAEAVRTLSALLPIGIQSRLVFLKRVEQKLGEANGEAILEGNKLLFDAGVLTELKLTYQRAKSSETARPASERAAAASTPEAQFELGALAAEITRLLTANRVRPAQLPGQRLIELDAAGVERKLAHIGDPGTIESDQFAQSIRRALATDANGREDSIVLSEPVENAIDLVGLMFDFVARDEALPKQIQHALTPLRMPLLRSALRGAHVFGGSDHPLRALMESAAEIGRSWTPETDRDGRVLAEIQGAVANAVSESLQDSGPEGIDRVQQDFRSFIATEQKRAQLQEKRASESAQAQERRLSAQRHSQHVIAEVLEQTPVPPVVGTLLNGPLRRHLELIHTRRGEDSKDWKSARKLVRDVVWSFDPVTISVERAHWQAMLPNIVGALRGALSAVGMHDNDIDGVVVEFRNRYRDLIAATQQQPGAAPAAFEKIDAEAMPDAPSVQVEAESVQPPAEVIEHAARTGLTYSDALAVVRALPTGAWVELVDGKGESQRAKLIWNSTVSQRCLFVNRNGQLVADRPYANLASDWMLGHVKRIEEGPLFARALTAVKLQLGAAQATRAA